MLPRPVCFKGKSIWLNPVPRAPLRPHHTNPDGILACMVYTPHQQCSERAYSRPELTSQLQLDANSARILYRAPQN